MKKVLIIIASVLAIAAQAKEAHDWENPHVLGINKLPYQPLATARTLGAFSRNAWSV